MAAVLGVVVGGAIKMFSWWWGRQHPFSRPQHPRGSLIVDRGQKSQMFAVSEKEPT